MVRKKTHLKVNIGFTPVESDPNRFKLFFQKFPKRTNTEGSFKNTKCKLILKLIRQNTYLCTSPLVASSIMITTSAVLATAITCLPLPFPVKTPVMY